MTDYADEEFAVLLEYKCRNTELQQSSHVPGGLLLSIISGAAEGVKHVLRRYFPEN